MIVLAAAFFGRLTGLWVGRHAAARVAALLVRNPLVVDRAALVAERTVLPEARVAMLAPLRWADLCLLHLRGDLANLLPSVTGCYAHSVIDRFFVEIVAPRHSFRNVESD